MRDRDLEHPDITAAIRTGYPKRAEPEVPYYCGECGEEIDEDEDIYSDRLYDCLCEDCLKLLHRRLRAW